MRTFAVYPGCLLICSVLNIVIYGCARAPEGPSKVYSRVPIATVHYDTLRHGREIKTLLIAHGINAETDAETTLVFTIFVPKGRAAEALSLLETNRLVLDGKVRLVRTSDPH